MRSVDLLFRSLGLVLLSRFGYGGASAQQVAATASALVVKPVAEKTVQSLPDQPLYWHVERFSNAAEAANGAAPEALIVDYYDKSWRFTLGMKRHARSMGKLMATIGPVPKPVATSYLLRINRASGPPGATTPVHSHPGSEAFFVLTGRLCQRTEQGTTQLDAGRAMNGDMPAMVMQVQSCGAVPLDQFVMFVVDAQKPFSSPATFRQIRIRLSPFGQTDPKTEHE